MVSLFFYTLLCSITVLNATITQHNDNLDNYLQDWANSNSMSDSEDFPLVQKIKKLLYADSITINKNHDPYFNNNTVLHVLADSENAEGLLHYFIFKKGADRTIKNNEGKTAADINLLFINKPDTVNKIFYKSLNPQTTELQSALNLKDTAYILSANLADSATPDTDNKTPLDQALANKLSENVITFLLKNGAQPSDENIRDIIRENYITALDTIMESTPLNKKINFLLWDARSEKIFEHLIKKGAQLTTQDNLGNTILHQHLELPYLYYILKQSPTTMITHKNKNNQTSFDYFLDRISKPIFFRKNTIEKTLQILDLFMEKGASKEHLMITINNNLQEIHNDLNETPNNQILINDYNRWVSLLAYYATLELHNDLATLALTTL